MELLSDDGFSGVRAKVIFNTQMTPNVSIYDIESVFFHNTPDTLKYEGINVSIKFSSVVMIGKDASCVTLYFSLQKRNRRLESKIKNYIEHNPDVIFSLFDRTTFFFDR